MTDARSGHALVLGDGDPPRRNELDSAWPGWAAGVSLVVAADGGARLAVELGFTIDEWVGDADSFPRGEVDRLADSGVLVDLVPTAKDESDLELAVVSASRSGVREITILGALGGARLDHELANVTLLAHPALADVEIARILDARARLSLVSAPDSVGRSVTRAFKGRAGDLVSLLPLGGAVRGITTAGLAYPLSDETLEVGPARGLSNVRTLEEAVVTVREGRLLVVETPATLRP
jgi:thiamine pyrophosphokinase